ncbi:Calx-beta domain-containing protein [Desulfovibrio cuneatus]|uniref:Calx-beta domain-containing protein n=1 Tax=Desulfovibrio cuneatus TaxID=159728 RepID=UPI00040B747F|nr:VCBS domain-containing protein [Desulfovibrio cuneatus]
MSQTNGKQAANSSPVVVPGVQANQEISIPAVAGAEVQFQFDPTSATVTRVDNSLVFTLDNGGKVTITDFFVTDGQPLPMLALPDGQVVPSEAVLAGLNGDMDLSTAAGPAARPPSSGGTSYEDSAGSLIGGTDRLGSLGTDGWGNSLSQPEQGIGTLEVPGGTFSFDASSDVGGAFGVSGGLYEDGMAYQNTGDTTVASGKLDFSFSGTGTTVVDSVSLTGLPVGTVVYIGNPDNPTQTITIETAGQAVSLTYSQLTGDGVYLLPPPNSDADMNINASVTLRATSSGVTQTLNGSFTIVVDAVADKPTEVEAAFVGGVDQTAIGNTLAGKEEQQVTIKAKAVFGGDADGADTDESHFVMVSGVPSDWSLASIPQGWVQVTDAARLAAMGAGAGDVVFEVSADLLQGANASVEGDVTFDTNEWSSERLGSGAVNTAGNATLTVKGVTWEENPSDGELTQDNNIATTSSQDMTVHFEESKPVITSQDLVLPVDETAGLQQQDKAVTALTPEAQAVLAGLGLGSTPAVAATQNDVTFSLGTDVTTPELGEGSRGIALSSEQTDPVYTASGQLLTIETVDGVLQGYYMEGGTKHLAFVVFSSDHNFAGGTGKLTFVQYEALRHADANNPDDVLPINVQITVTDADGDSVTTSLTITVHDDGPTAIAESEMLGEHDTSVSGNVLGNDQFGADGRAATNGLDFNTEAGKITYTLGDGTTVALTLDAEGFLRDAFNQNYGKLTLNEADGSYTYTVPGKSLNALEMDGTIKVDYTLKDADNDTASATLSITVKGEDLKPEVIINAGANNLLVDEAALDTIGTNAAANAEHASGSLDVSSYEQLTTITVGGVVLTLKYDASGTLSGYDVDASGENVPNGDLAIAASGAVSVAYAADGKATYTVTYSYTLTDPRTVDTDADTITVPVTVTDKTGDEANGNFTITIKDDAPIASNESVALDTTSSSETSVPGNVLDNDQFGADGRATTDGLDFHSAAGEITYTLGNGTTVALTLGADAVLRDANGQNYGKLTLNEADGSYTYTVPGKGQSVVELDGTIKVGYTLKDADNDTANATLSITVKGEDLKPEISIDAGASNLNVDEAALDSIGTNAASNAEHASGSLAVSSYEQLTTINVGGVVLTLNYGADGKLAGYSVNGTAENVPNGDLTIAATDAVSVTYAADGKATYTVEYSYTLTAPRTFDGDFDTISVPVTVTDKTGDVANANFTITVQDDALTAAPDTNTFTEGSQTSVSGNVVTGEGQTGGKDTIGADGLKDVQFHGLTVTSGSLVDNNNGTYTYQNADGTTAGTLTLKADGSYTFEKTGGIQNSFTLECKYAATDNDGDRAESTLTINVEAAPITVGLSGSAQAYESNANNTQGAGEYTLNIYDESNGIATGGQIPDDITVTIKVTLDSAKLEDFDQAALETLDGYTVQYDNHGKAVSFTFTQTISHGDADGKLTFNLPFNDDHITENTETYTVSIEKVEGGTGVYVSEKADASTVDTTLIDDGSTAHPKDGPVVNVVRTDGTGNSWEGAQDSSFEFKLDLKDPHTGSTYAGDSDGFMAQDTVVTITLGGSAQLGTDFTLDTSAFDNIPGLSYEVKDNTIIFTITGQVDANGNLHAPGTAVFNVSDLGKLTFQANVISDAMAENAEAITLNVTTDGGNESANGSGSSVTIESDPKLSLAWAAGSVNESQGNITASLTLDKPLGEDVTVTLKLGGTAQVYQEGDTLALKDYTLPEGWKLESDGNGGFNLVGTIKAGTSGTIPLEFGLVDDHISESNESITLQLDNATYAGGQSNVTIGTTGTQTVTITDDNAIPNSDGASSTNEKDGPVVGIKMDGASSAAENSGTTFTFQVTLTDPHARANEYSGFEDNNTLSQDMVLTLQVGGAATLGKDYTLDFTSLNELKAAGVLTYTADANGKITITLHGQVDASGNPSGHTPFNMADLDKLQVGATISNDMVTEKNSESITMNVITDGKNESTGGGTATATIEGDTPVQYNGPFVEFGKANYGSVQESNGKLNFTLELRDPADKTQPYSGTGLEQDIVATIKVDFTETFQAHDLKFYTQSGNSFTAKQLDTASLRSAGPLFVNIGDPDGDGNDNYAPITLQPATGTPTGFTFDAKLPVGPAGDADGKYDLSLEMNDDPFGASEQQKFDKPDESIKMEIVGVEGSEARIGDVANTEGTVTDDVPEMAETGGLEGLKVGLHLATTSGTPYTNAEVNEGLDYRLYVDLTTQNGTAFGTGNNPYANYTGNQVLPEDLVITITLEGTADLGDDFTVSWNLPAGAEVSGPNANGEYTLTLKGGIFNAADAGKVWANIDVKGDNINEHGNANQYLDDKAADEKFSFTVTDVKGNESSITDKAGAHTTERTINDVADGKLTLSGGTFDTTHTEWGFGLKVGYGATEGNGGNQLPGETVHMQLKVSDSVSMQHGEEYRLDAYSLFCSLNAGDADLQGFLNANGITDLATYNAWVNGNDLSAAAGDKGLIFVDGDDAGWAKGDSIVYDVYVPKDSWKADGSLTFSVDQGDHHGGRDDAGFTVELVNPYDKNGDGVSDAGQPGFDMKGEIVQVVNPSDVAVSDAIQVSLSNGHTIREGGTEGIGGTAVEQYTVQFANANAATVGGTWKAAGDVMFDLTIKPTGAEFDSNTSDNIGNGTVKDFALADFEGKPLDMGNGTYDLSTIDTPEEFALLSQKLFGANYPNIQVTGITYNGNNVVFAVKVAEGYDLSQGVKINFITEDDRVSEPSENFVLTVTDLHSNKDLDLSTTKNSGTTTIVDEGDVTRLNGFALALKDGGAVGVEKSETGVSVTVKAYILSNGVDGTGCNDGQVITLDDMKALYTAETGNSYSGANDADFEKFVIDHFGPTQPITLDFGFSDDSAVRNADYRTDQTSFTRGPGGWTLVIDENTGEISFERNDINITTINDNLDEGTEQFDITLNGVSSNESRLVNGADGVTENTTVKADIIDVHDGPVLEGFGLNDESLVEPDRYDVVDGQRLHTVEYILNLSKATAEPVTVWLDAGGAASLGIDYSFGEGVYTYQNGSWHTFTATGELVASNAPAGFRGEPKEGGFCIVIDEGQSSGTVNVVVLHDNDEKAVAEGVDNGTENINLTVTDMTGSEVMYKDPATGEVKPWADKPAGLIVDEGKSDLNIIDDMEGPAISVGLGGDYNARTITLHIGEDATAPITEPVTVKLQVTDQLGNSHEVSITVQPADLHDASLTDAVNKALADQKININNCYVQIIDTTGGETQVSGGPVYVNNDSGPAIIEIKGFEGNTITEGDGESPEYTMNLLISQPDKLPNTLSFDLEHLGGTASLSGDLANTGGAHVEITNIDALKAAGTDVTLTINKDGVFLQDGTQIGTVTGDLPVALDDTSVEGTESFYTIITNPSSPLDIDEGVATVEVIDTTRVGIVLVKEDGTLFTGTTEDAGLLNLKAMLVIVDPQGNPVLVNGEFVQATTEVPISFKVGYTNAEGTTGGQGADFTGNNVITFPVGSGTVDFNLMIQEDRLSEGTEKFDVSFELTDKSKTELGGSAQNNIVGGKQGFTITDEDTSLQIGFTSDSSVSEADTLTVTYFAEETMSGAALPQGGQAGGVNKSVVAEDVTITYVITPKSAGFDLNDIKSMTVNGKTYTHDGPAGANLSDLLTADGNGGWEFKVTLNKGVAYGEFKITLNNDVLTEGSEQFGLAIKETSGSESLVGPGSDKTINVEDVLDGARLGIVAGPMAEEGDYATATIKMTAGMASEEPSTITLTVKDGNSSNLSDKFDTNGVIKVNGFGGEATIDLKNAQNGIATGQITAAGKTYDLKFDLNTGKLTIDMPAGVGNTSQDITVSFPVQDSSVAGDSGSFTFGLEVNGGEMQLAGSNPPNYQAGEWTGEFSAEGTSNGGSNTFKIAATGGSSFNDLTETTETVLTLGNLRASGSSVDLVQKIIVDGVEIPRSAWSWDGQNVVIHTGSCKPNYEVTLVYNTVGVNPADLSYAKGNVDLSASVVGYGREVVTQIGDETDKTQFDGPEASLVNVAESVVEGSVVEGDVRVHFPMLDGDLNPDGTHTTVENLNVTLQLSKNINGTYSSTVEFGGNSYVVNQTTGQVTVSIPKGTLVDADGNLDIHFTVTVPDNTVTKNPNFSITVVDLKGDTGSDTHYEKYSKDSTAETVTVTDNDTDSGPTVSLGSNGAGTEGGKYYTYLSIQNPSGKDTIGTTVEAMRVTIQVGQNPDGTYSAPANCSSNATIKDWNPETGQFVLEIMPGTSFSPTSTWFYMNTADNSLASNPPATLTIINVEGAGSGNTYETIIHSDETKSVTLGNNGTPSGPEFTLTVDQTSVNEGTDLAGTLKLAFTADKANPNTLGTDVTVNLTLNNANATFTLSQAALDAGVTCTQNGAKVTIIFPNGSSMADFADGLDYSINVPKDEMKGQNLEITVDSVTQSSNYYEKVGNVGDSQFEVPVIPVTDQPTDQSVAPGQLVEQDGHVASVSFTLAADFADKSGTEEHFFLVALPAGAIPPAGWVAITDLALLQAAGLGDKVYKVPADAQGDASFDLQVPEHFAGGDLQFRAGAVETGQNQPTYEVSEIGSSSIAPTGIINLVPEAQASLGALDGDLPYFDGSLAVQDPDGDSWQVVSVSVGDQVHLVPENGFKTIEGEHGTLTLHADGTYHYELHEGEVATDINDMESFGYTVRDSHGGESTSSIDITLGQPADGDALTPMAANAAFTLAGDHLEGVFADQALYDNTSHQSAADTAGEQHLWFDSPNGEDTLLNDCAGEHLLLGQAKMAEDGTYVHGFVYEGAEPLNIQVTDDNNQVLSLHDVLFTDEESALDTYLEAMVNNNDITLIVQTGNTEHTIIIEMGAGAVAGYENYTSFVEQYNVAESEEAQSAMVHQLLTSITC